MIGGLAGSCLSAASGMGKAPAPSLSVPNDLPSTTTETVPGSPRFSPSNNSVADWIASTAGRMPPPAAIEPDRGKSRSPHVLQSFDIDGGQVRPLAAADDDHRRGSVPIERDFCQFGTVLDCGPAWRCIEGDDVGPIELRRIGHAEPHLDLLGGSRAARQESHAGSHRHNEVASLVHKQVRVVAPDTLTQCGDSTCSLPASMENSGA